MPCIHGRRRSGNTRQGQRAAPARSRGERDLAVEQRAQCRARQFDADVRVGAARIVRIRRGEDAAQRAVSVAGDCELAVIGLEVQQSQEGTRGHGRTAGIKRIGQAARGRGLEPPAQAEAPEGGVQRVRVAQQVEVHRHDVDARGPQRGEFGWQAGTVAAVDRIDEYEHRQLRICAMPGQQSVAQPGRQRRQARIGRSLDAAALRIEEEVVQDEQVLRACDQRQRRVEDLLRDHRLAEGVAGGDIGEEAQPRGIDGDCFAGNVNAGRQLLGRLPDGSREPREQQAPCDSTQQPAATGVGDARA